MPEPTRVTDIDELEAWFEASRERPVFLFKHSLTCPISSSAHDAYRRFAAERDGEAEFTLVEVQRARRVSNEIAARTGLRHESPQAILLRDGEPVWHASHYAIRESALEGALAG